MKMCDGSGPICGVLVDGGKLRSFWCNTILLFSDVTAPLPPVGLQPRQLCPLRWLQPPPRCAIVGRGQAVSGCCGHGGDDRIVGGGGV